MCWLCYTAHIIHEEIERKSHLCGDQDKSAVTIIRISALLAKKLGYQCYKVKNAKMKTKSKKDSPIMPISQVVPMRQKNPMLFVFN
jgi:hypothetical protein